MNSEFSIYIPRMSTLHSVETIVAIFNSYGIGIIDRVDFTPINKKPGFGENVDFVVKSAFVHFSYPRTVSGSQGEIFWKTISSGEPYKIQVYENEYWICLKNKKPIQRTLMNIHQVVENGRHLENMVQEQAKKIEELERKLNGMQEVVYQLVGGLFCHRTQENILKLHKDILFDGSGSGKYHEDDNKWRNFPTTRQGDECERRIEALENALLRNQQEDQDTELLHRKYHKMEIDDESTINSELIGENIIDSPDYYYETPDYRWRHQK